ncbi:uncharacterized protein Tco025E_10176, partial [Trypanosoma conorhini]
REKRKSKTPLQARERDVWPTWAPTKKEGTHAWYASSLRGGVRVCGSPRNQQAAKATAAASGRSNVASTNEPTEALLCPRVSESCPQWRWLHLGPRQPRRRKRCGWTRRSGPAKLRTLATLRPHAADRVPRRLGLPPAAAAPHHGFGALLRPPSPPPHLHSPQLRGPRFRGLALQLCALRAFCLRPQFAPRSESLRAPFGPIRVHDSRGSPGR